MKRLPIDDSFKVNRNPITLREIVLDKLRSAIMNFQLLPGDRLVERDLRQLQARISYLRATSVSQENRRSASNAEMERIVEAIKSGDPLAAHQASVDHVRSAAIVALDSLKSKQDDGSKVRELFAPVALKDPRIGR